MSDADDQKFVPESEAAPIVDDNAAEQEDAAVAKSEETGTVSKDEVEGLKDSIGGGEVLDDSEGYTRSSNQEKGGYAKKEEELDQKVEAAMQE